ncbi:MAG: transposase [Pseudomonadota bacterium]
MEKTDEDHCRYVLNIHKGMGRLKGQMSMKLFHQFRQLKKKPYWGNHFWAKDYCVDTVGLDADMIRKYVRYQERKEKQEEQLQLFE